MSNIAVVYKSKYGSTKKYAQWIANALKADIFEVSKVNIDNLKKYSTIVYGGGMYMGSILGVSFITKNFESLKNKKLVVFAVGLEDSSNANNFKIAIDKTFTEEMQKSIKIFHFRGAIDYKKLGLFHKFSMAMLIKMLKKTPREQMDETTKAIIDSYGQKIDYINENSIKPLVEYYKAL